MNDDSKIIMDINQQSVYKYLENKYKSRYLTYETMLVEFLGLSGFRFYFNKMHKGSVIARCRYNTDNKSFKKISDISYPSNEILNGFSRLNRPNQKLLYCCESEYGCLAEMIPIWSKKLKSNGEYIVTSSLWKTNRDLTLIIFPDFENSSPYNNVPKGDMDINENIFWEYISKKFKTNKSFDSNIYNFTSAFSNALWINANHQNIHIDGFVYSNVLLDNYVNIAIDPRVVDSNDIVPTEVVELSFDRRIFEGELKPNYADSGKRKRGSANLEKQIIVWD